MHDVSDGKVRCYFSLLFPSRVAKSRCSTSNHAMAPNVPFEPELVFAIAAVSELWGVVYLAMKTIQSHAFRCLDTLSLQFLATQAYEKLGYRAN